MYIYIYIYIYTYIYIYIYTVLPNTCLKKAVLPNNMYKKCSLSECFLKAYKYYTKVVCGESPCLFLSNINTAQHKNTTHETQQIPT